MNRSCIKTDLQSFALVRSRSLGVKAERDSRDDLRARAIEHVGVERLNKLRLRARKREREEAAADMAVAADLHTRLQATYTVRRKKRECAHWRSKCQKMRPMRIRDARAYVCTSARDFFFLFFAGS